MDLKRQTHHQIETEREREREGRKKEGLRQKEAGS